MERAMAETGIATRTAEIPLMANMRETGVVPEIPWMARIEEHAAWPILLRLPITLTARISLSRFNVRDLLRLEVGQVVESRWPETEDVPLMVGQVKLGWCEFEVVEKKIGVRLTRLA
jgi:flagellar motor switch/type III secretory pathway protein FliN